jgi:hypothetical protein
VAADYVSAITGLASMVASALAQKHAKAQEKADTRADTAYDIAMENAASLGAPGARYMQQAHDARVHNQRLDRIPIDYGRGLELIGRSAAGALGGSSSGNDGAGRTPDVNAALSQSVPNSQLDYTLQLPKSNGPLYPTGASPHVAPVPQLVAPNWDELDPEQW